MDEICVPISFLRYSYNAYGSLATPSWIAETWRFLSDSKIKVIDPFVKPQLACLDDSFLMERFYAYGYRGKELALLNSPARPAALLALLLAAHSSSQPSNPLTQALGSIQGLFALHCSSSAEPTS